MAADDEVKTAFMTESGNYYCRVMPFGLRNAGPTYQRMMNKVYEKNLLGDILEVYMDDIIVEAKIPLKLFLNDKQTLVLKLRL